MRCGRYYCKSKFNQASDDAFCECLLKEGCMGAYEKAFLPIDATKMYILTDSTYIESGNG